MRSEVDNKKWGTIYLGGNQEATLDSLDAMQAASRQEQWNQRTQNEYMDRVRERATDRAREILGAAHTERQNILTEVRAEADRIILEAQAQHAKANEALAQAAAQHAEAQTVREEAEALRNAARQEGFDAGLADARDELDAFRGAMGASIAVVLQAIERQNGAIFASWREEVVELVKTCVEKGTDWVLDTRYTDVLRALVMESVRQLDDRHSVTLRVHPDDEAAVADMFAAAREAMPDVERWIVNGDDTVQLGGLIAESFSSTVDNRVELRRNLVNTILQHLSLPEGEAEVLANSVIHEVVAEQVAHIAELAPPVPDLVPETAEPEMPVPDAAHALQEIPEPNEDTFAELAAAMHAQALMDEALPAGAETHTEEFSADMSGEAPEAFLPSATTAPEMTQTLPADIPPAPDGPALAEQEPAPLQTPPAETSVTTDPFELAMAATEASSALSPENPPVDTTSAPPQHTAVTESMEHEGQLSRLEELERELLPLPEEQSAPESEPLFTQENSSHVDEVLAGGGFLSESEAVHGAER